MPKPESPANQLPLFDIPAIDAPPVSDAHAKVAAEMPAGVHIGTSSWSFPGWADIVYDRKARQPLLASEGLRAYAKHPLLGCVGIDRTFYAPPVLEDLVAYADQVPDGFRFVMKAPQDLTWLVFPNHPRYGDRAGEPNPHALDPGRATRELVEPALEGLGDKLGAIVFQFPPQRAAPLEGEPPFADRVATFLGALPRGPLYAIEIRNTAWLDDAYADMLTATGAVHCHTIHPTMPPITEQAEVTRAADAPALVIRWMLAGRQTYDDAKSRYAPFNKLIDPDPTNRTTIATLIKRMAAQNRPTYITINNKAEGSAPLSAFALAEELTR